MGHRRSLKGISKSVPEGILEDTLEDIQIANLEYIGSECSIKLGNLEAALE